MDEDSWTDSSIVKLYKEKFTAKAYCESYFKKNDIDWEFLLTMYHEYFSKNVKHQGKESNPKLLEFGCGPVPIYAATAASTSFTNSITFADLVEGNRTAITNWMQQTPDAFNWDEQFDCIENLSDKTSSDIKNSLRSAFQEVVSCDIKKNTPISGKENYFDIIMTNMCLECACIGIDDMKQGIANLGNLLKPGGILIEAGDLRSEYYPLEEVTYPMTHLTKDNIKDMYQDPDLGMQLLELKYKANTTEEHNEEYFLIAQKMDKATPVKELIEKELYGFKAIVSLQRDGDSDSDSDIQ